jgi:hypothetical protein
MQPRHPRWARPAAHRLRANLLDPDLAQPRLDPIGGLPLLGRTRETTGQLGEQPDPVERAHLTLEALFAFACHETPAMHVVGVVPDEPGSGKRSMRLSSPVANYLRQPIENETAPRRFNDSTTPRRCQPRLWSNSARSITPTTGLSEAPGSGAARICTPRKRVTESAAFLRSSQHDLVQIGE